MWDGISSWYINTRRFENDSSTAALVERSAGEIVLTPPLKQRWVEKHVCLFCVLSSSKLPSVSKVNENLPCGISYGKYSWRTWERQSLWWWKRKELLQYLRQPARIYRSWSNPVDQLRKDHQRTAIYIQIQLSSWYDRLSVILSDIN